MIPLIYFKTIITIIPYLGFNGYLPGKHRLDAIHQFTSSCSAKRTFGDKRQRYFKIFMGQHITVSKHGRKLKTVTMTRKNH